MIYKNEEYKPLFDTPMKKIQEIAIATAIMKILNKNKYDNLEEFIAKNPNYQDFLKKFDTEPIILNFRHELNHFKEEDYIKVLENLRLLTKTKKEFEQENIKTTNLDNKKFGSLKGSDKTYIVETSRYKKDIEEKMRDLQPTQEQFQTSNRKQNAENLFRELESRQEGLSLHSLNEINYDALGNEEKLLFQIAESYQKDSNGVICVDLKKGIIVDEDDNIMKIEEVNGEFTITKNENGVEKQEQPTKVHQKTLIPNT